MKKLLPLGVIASLVFLTVLFAGAGNYTAERPAEQSLLLPSDSQRAEPENSSLADSIVEFGLSFSGTPYFYTGKRPQTGFDCSGFTHYVFGHFGIELSPASREQIFAGTQVGLDKVKKGDLLVFTGTRVSVRKPGHVGIVISEPGESPVRFVHSSSNGGVKVSEVQGTRYADRLLQVRRLF